MEKEVHIYNEKEYEFITNIEMRALKQSYIVCKQLNIPAYYDETAYDASGNIIPGYVAMYVPLNFDQNIMTMYMIVHGNLCWEYKQKLIKEGKITTEEASDKLYYLGEFE